MLRAQPDWEKASAEPETALRLRAVAEQKAIDQVLFRQAVDLWDFELDQAAVEAEFARLSALQGCRTGANAIQLREQVIQGIRVQNVLEALAPHVRKPTREDAKRFFGRNRRQFGVPEMIHAAHIVKNIDERCTEGEAAETMRAAERELQEGAPFAEVAERYSDCKGQGGELSPFPRGEMVEEFEEAVLGLEPGRRSPIFRTPFGLHIAEVRRRVPECQKTFEQARADIEGMLALQAQQRAYEYAVGVLRQQSRVERPDNESASGASA